MTTSEFLQGIGAVGMVFCLWRSVQMIRHPERHLGIGTYPAIDPRTVRQFGIACAALFGLPVLFILIQLVPE